MIKELWGAFKRYVLNDERGQWESLIGTIAAPLISGLFGGQAAAPAAQTADQSAQAMADMINSLVSQYQNVFAPAQSNIMSQYMGMAGGVPMADITQFQILQDLLPVFMPDVLRSRAEYRVRQGAENQMEQLQYDLARRGITGPAAQALMDNIREAEVQGLAGVGAETMTWEAEQTLAARRKAFEDALQVLGLAGQYSSIGSGMPGTAMAGAGSLLGASTQAAQAAAAPWSQLGSSIGDWISQQNWFGGGGTPTAPPASPTYSFAGTGPSGPIAPWYPLPGYTGGSPFNP